jgi:sugar-specific transcriptional regulator TrmB
MIEELVERLKVLGLSPYEAKAYAVLLSVGEATAREISDLSNIPRTKVYDVLKRLADKGFVEVQPGTPTLFKASEPSEVAGIILRDIVKRVKEFVEIAENVKIEKRKRVQLVWVSRGKFAVESRIKEVVDGAEDELLLFLIDSSIRVEIPKPEIARILLLEKVAVPNRHFRIVDRNKLRKSNHEFFRKFVELLEGYSFEGVKVKPVLLCIADGKKSVLAFKEGDELVAVTITIPLVVLLQKAMFEALWREFT